MIQWNEVLGIGHWAAWFAREMRQIVGVELLIKMPLITLGINLIGLRRVLDVNSRWKSIWISTIEHWTSLNIGVDFGEYIDFIMYICTFATMFDVWINGIRAKLSN